MCFFFDFMYFHVFSCVIMFSNFFHVFPRFPVIFYIYKVRFSFWSPNVEKNRERLIHCIYPISMIGIIGLSRVIHGFRCILCEILRFWVDFFFCAPNWPKNESTIVCVCEWKIYIYLEKIEENRSKEPIERKKSRFGKKWTFFKMDFLLSKKKS